MTLITNVSVVERFAKGQKVHNYLLVLIELVSLLCVERARRLSVEVARLQS